MYHSIHMATLVTDRAKIIHHLQTKGYSQDQAEGFADALSELDTSELATRDFVHSENANLKASLVMWFVGVEIATTALIISVIAGIL